MQFYDINKYPKKSGLLVFGISMSKISNSQEVQSFKTKEIHILQ